VGAAAGAGQTELERDVLAEVQRLEPQLVDLACELVRTRSVNPSYPAVQYDAEVGGEGACTAVIAAALEGEGIELDRFGRAPGRENLAAVLRGSGGGRTLVLNGHVDTVSPGDSAAWRSEPLSGHVEDGRVWGLGASDMKGPVAAGAVALKALARHSSGLRGSVVLQCVVGEESSEADMGARAVIEAGYTGNAGICMEPTGQMVGGDPRLTLAPVSFGTLILRFTVEGRAVHAGRRREVMHPTAGPRVGVSAWEKGLLLTSALQRLEAAWGFSKRSPYYPPGQFVLNPGVVRSRAKGADSAFFVPDEFVAEYVIFYSPHDPREAVRAEVLECLRGACAQDDWLSEHPPVVEWLPSIPASDVGDDPLLGIASDAIATVTGEHPSLQGLVAGCDAGWLCEAGIPTLVYGPGDIANAHAPDESVSIAELVQAAKVYALTALRYCGHEDI
jgi:formylaminopyrimidine deformylase